MSFNRTRFGLTVVTMLALGLAVSSPALAHCDGMDGPLVKAAQKAPQTGEPNGIRCIVPRLSSASRL